MKTSIIFDFAKLTETATGDMMSIKEFINDWKLFGLKIAFGDWLVCFTKWYLKAKRIQITYGHRKQT